jgi:hypothetical protein
MHSDNEAKSLMKEVIIGVFRRPRAARRAIEALRELGFFDNQLGLLSDEVLLADERAPAMGKRETFQAEDLVGLGLPEHEVEYYARELKRGHSVIVVDPVGRTLHALTVLDRQSPFERAIFRVPPFVPATLEAAPAVVALG